MAAPAILRNHSAHRVLHGLCKAVQRSMKHLRISDELAFEEHDGKLFVITSCRPRREGLDPLPRRDATTVFTREQTAKLREFLCGETATHTIV